MNLHDIPEAQPRVNWYDDLHNVLRRSIDEYVAAPPPAWPVSPNLEGNATVRAPDPTRNQIYPTYREAVIAGFDEPPPEPTIQTYRGTDRVGRLVQEIYRLRAELERYRIPHGGAERLAIRVTPGEYHELQQAYTRNGDSPVHVDYVTGTMSVMGLTVLPSR